MFRRQTFENSRPDGFPVLEIANSESGPQRLFVPLKRTLLRGEIVGPLAAMRLTQTYGYSAAVCDKVLEAIYRFPLPGDAAVRSVTVRFGDVTIQTELKERRQATTEYEQARQAGHQAVLATRESPDVFTLQIAGLRPDEDIVVDTYYVQLARNEGAGWSLRTPLTTAPRYVRSDEVSNPHAQGQPLLVMRDPGHRFAMDVTIRQCGSVDSATHKLELTRDGETCRVRLRDGDVLPDCDCVVSWRATQAQDRPGLAVLLEDAPGTEHVYFLALVAPPATFDRGSAVPREAILLVDHSGSMSGAKWQAADWAVERFLSDLNPRDSLALGLFHNATRWFDSQPRSASEDVVRNAVSFLKQHTDSGGTELGVALEQALELSRSENAAARHVLIITDAEVTDGGRIMNLADQESKKPQPRRISVLCIDAAPNSLLATELAERGGGVARFLTSRPFEGDITTALDEVLADWSEPVLSGLKLEVNRADVEVVGRRVSPSTETGWSTIDLGDLPAGRPIWCVGRVPRSGSGELIFRTTAGKGHQLASCRQKPDSTTESRPMIRALFGARRILGLEYLLNAGWNDIRTRLGSLGYDPDKIFEKATSKPKVYAENARIDLHAALRALLVDESLLFGLASAETAFVAVRSQPGKPVESAVIVGNAFPAGWAESAAFGMVTGHAVRSRRAPTAGAMALYGTASFFAPDGCAMYSLADSADLVCTPTACVSAAAEAVPSQCPPSVVLFEGAPRFDDSRAVLFDSTTQNADWPISDRSHWNGLKVECLGSAVDPKTLDRGLCLLLYVEDQAVPRARVGVADILRAGGKRPLNISWVPGQRICLVLHDPAGSWRKDAPTLRVTLDVAPC
jgi:Ca-activated chloride channel homolog